MRRKRINWGWWRILRSGVIDSVMATKRSVQSPVACSRNCVGFEPNPPWNASQMSTPRGTVQIRNTTTFVHLLLRIEFIFYVRSVIFLQIHAIVEARHFITITVEHLRRGVLEESWQTDFLGLAPARMVHHWIHV